MLEIPADSTDAADSAPADAADSPPEPAPATDSIPADPEVFEVPEPPPLEEAAALVEPRPAPTPPPKPKPAIQTTKPKPPRQPAASTPGTRPTSPSGTPGSSGTAQGGTPGGSGRKPAASGVPGGKGRMPQPPYPSFARSRGLQGTVVVSISAAPDGTVTNASVARSSGSPDLDRYAVSWIRSRWRMPAGTSSGQQTIHFRLR
jgi:protein TonB